MGVKEKVLENFDELQKYIVLLVHANNEPVKGKTKLQKMMFLLSDKIDEIKEESSYDADNFGPYSEIVTEELEYLEQIGVLTNSSGEIAITETGKEIAREIAKKEDQNILKILDEYKKFLNDLSTNELLAYIYSAYSNMTEESVEFERLKPHMEDHLLSLVNKQKISAQRAAELLNRSQEYVIKKMNNKGIQVLGEN